MKKICYAVCDISCVALIIGMIVAFASAGIIRAETLSTSIKDRTVDVDHDVEASMQTGNTEISVSGDKHQATDTLTRIELAGTQPPQRLDEGAITNNQEKISLKYKDGDLRNILRLIARVSGINLVAGPDVQGKVTLELDDVTWEQALTLVLNVNGYTYIRDGNIIRVISTAQVEKEPLSVGIVPINYAKVDEMVTVLKSLSTPARGMIQADTRANVLIITDIPAKVNQIEAVAQRLDQPTPQVLIETLFVEIGVGNTDTIGTDWSSFSDYGFLLHDMLYTFDKNITEGKTKTSAYGTDQQSAQRTRDFNQQTEKDLSYTLEPDEFRLAVSMLLNDQRVKLINHPKIQTMDNQKATIRVAEVQYKPTYTYNQETGSYEINNLEEIYIGITLEVTPHVSFNDTVTLDILPEVSDLAGVQIIQGVEIPITKIRQVKTRVSLQDKHTVAIGGLMSDRWKSSTKGLPYFSELPYVGDKLFSWSSKEKQTDNLIIFLTPIIIRPEEEHGRFDKQLREMQLTRDGDFVEVVSNYPSWHRLYMHEQMLVSSATNAVPVRDDHYWYPTTK